MTSMLWAWMAVGCVDEWCGRFNLQCDSTSITVPDLVDLDRDAWAEDDDCDDTNALIFPAAPELCNQIDDDCDGVVDDGLPPLTRWYWDGDGDGFGGTAYLDDCVEQPSSYVATSDDCDDGNWSVNPGAAEVCNTLDDDCDGLVDDMDPDVGGDALSTWFVDADGDGAAPIGGESVQSCAPPDAGGYTAREGDCDDSDPTVGPDAAEICADGIDQDCNGFDLMGVCGAMDTSMADATLVGVQADDRAGTAFAIIDADGPDPSLVIGAPGPGITAGGTVYVGPAHLEGEVALVDFGAMWWGPEASQAGSALVALADYGTTGKTALLVGAPERFGDAGTTGAVYLLQDPTGDGGPLEDSDVVIVGDLVGHRLGGGIGLGDTDGDGAVDAVVSATSALTEQPSLWLWSGVAPSQADFDLSPRIWADADTYLFGHSFVVSDFNSDGVDDLVVAGMSGLVEDLEEPLAYFEGPVTGDVAMADAGWAFTSSQPLEGLPMRLTVVGDHDGDGRRDLAVASRGVGGFDEGSVAVFVDFETAPGALTDAHALIIAGDGAIPLGQETSYQPSATGAAVDDLLFTVPGEASSAGDVLVMWGPISGTVLARDAQASISGVAANLSFGATLAPPLDLDGDGGIDVLAGTDPSLMGSTEPTRVSLFLLDY